MKYSKSRIMMAHSNTNMVIAMPNGKKTSRQVREKARQHRSPAPPCDTEAGSTPRSNDEPIAIAAQPHSPVESFLMLSPEQRRGIYLSPREVAHRIQLNERTIRTWVAEGKITGVTVGRMWVVWESVVKFLAEEDRRRKGF